MTIRTRWELMPTYYPAHVLRTAVNLSLFKTLMRTDAHLLPCPSSKKCCQPVLVQNSYGTWCPPLTLPLFWEMLSTCPCAKLWWELMPTCYPTHVLKGYCLPVPVGTHAHLLPCPCSKRILSTCPCSKLWWELMPTCYPANDLKRYCQPVPVQNSDGNWCPHIILPLFCEMLSTFPCVKLCW